ncbi:MAG: hypothetical protein HC836_47755 [Richelia sp. RM2_1_2]|nr:hypothetical protein [Richelia sp. RM2_1_2]
MDELIGQLSPEQYFKWRFFMEDMLHWETRIKLSRLHYSHMEKDIEIQKLKAAIHKNIIKDHEATSKLKKEEYEAYRQELEKQLGVSLDDCAIDDYTYEIKRIPKE